MPFVISTRINLVAFHLNIPACNCFIAESVIQFVGQAQGRAAKVRPVRLRGERNQHVQKMPAMPQRVRSVFKWRIMAALRIFPRQFLYVTVFTCSTAGVSVNHLTGITATRKRADHTSSL